MNDCRDEEKAGAIRDAGEVARRALALFAVSGRAAGAERRRVLAWLTNSGLASELTPRERAFVESERRTRKQSIEFGWHSERIVVLLWALGLVSGLPADDEQCDTAVFGEHLPPIADVEVEDFIAAARLRPHNELIAMADRLLYRHWEARNDALGRGKPKIPVDIEIVQERHHAINWVIGYDGLPWDEVTTDT